MYYFGHGETHLDELVQASEPADYTVLFLVGTSLALLALALISRRKRSSKK